MKCTPQQILMYLDQPEVNEKRGIPAQNKTLGVQGLDLFIDTLFKFWLWIFGEHQKECHRVLDGFFLDVKSEIKRERQKHLLDLWTCFLSHWCTLV